MGEFSNLFENYFWRFIRLRETIRIVKPIAVKIDTTLKLIDS